MLATLQVSNGGFCLCISLTILTEVSMVTGRAGARYGTARPFGARPSIFTGVVPATTGG